MSLDTAPQQLQAWIDEIDIAVGELTLRRIAFVRALEAFDTPTPATTEPHTEPAPVDQPTAKNLGGRPRSALPPDKALEHRRQRDAERQQRRRSGVKAPARSNGTSKYDYAEVARVANAAIRAGIRPTTALIQKYDVKDAMAAWLMKEARKRGFEIGRLGSTKPAVPTPSRADSAPALHVVQPAQSSHTSPPAGGAFTPADALKLLDR